ncbi:MAG: alpha/beta hydrolase [Oscillospiraceae bacterium]|nr:alpha/beta hydrolase [Oscillospiraceae bacterium]
MNSKTDTVYIPGPGGFLRALLIRPEGESSAQGRPGVLWIHGGGYSMGMPEMAYFSRAISLVRKFGAVVLAPDYRLSHEAPYPAALEDCYASLLWLRDHTEDLGIRRDQLMVGGESAGGGLTAALCMLARDKGEVNIAYQMPLYPMLDDRDTPSSKDNHAPVWNTRRNHRGWQLYLRDLQGAEPPAYAAPARQTDFSNLPPAYTFVGDAEPFYCETLDFVQHLRDAGVEAEVDVFPGCFHAFDLYEFWSEQGKTAVERFEEQFQYALDHYFAQN